MDDWLKEAVAKYKCRLTPTGNIVMAPARLSFPHLFKPKADDNGVEKYSCMLLFPKGIDFSMVRKELERVRAEKFGQRKGGHQPLALQDVRIQALADAGKGGADTYESGAYYINCTSKNKPGVRTTKNGLQIDCAESDVYAGCWVLASVRPFAFDAGKKWGVSLGLQHIFKLRDGRRIGGGSDASEDFSGLEAMEGGGDIDVDAMLADA